nr:hypothetical protein Iba_chr09eCG8340 [Ipomoea batatas]
MYTGYHICQAVVRVLLCLIRQRELISRTSRARYHLALPLEVGISQF